ncbi:probable protein phosphatase 2C 38 [Phoenix dactylifera]|uniref:protein-serine/threonine phosphatase n=1 Tax=Phoenix dactylifera TaxID=42345 RepID=A0A8B7MTQ0_PHODC|nr:probable protein phosphatase 2C 38 [Phoenix dactylifera]
MRSPGGLDEGMVRSFTLMKIVSPCWKLSPESRGDDSSGRFGAGRADGLLWYKDLGRHAGGEFSMAVVQANNLLEDGSQIESGPLSLYESSPPHGTFVGVYDGHGGPETSKYITNNLFWNLKKYALEQKGMSVDVIRKAFSATEEGFISLVRKQWLTKPQLASVGSCCLIGVICGGVLYVANLGDSRAVLGRLESDIREVKAVQLSTEHNASFESIREELRSMHPDDSQIVVLKHKVWRVKGLIQVSRSIGDAYLKDAEFNREPLLSRFRLPEPFCKSILSAEPTIVTHKLCPKDQFLIFASDGLWEHLSNQEAVEMVHNSPRSGIARKLIKAAMQEAAKKRELRYSDLKKIDRGIRRHFHDDITVIVIFLDHTQISKNFYHGPVLSLRGGGNPVPV